MSRAWPVLVAACALVIAAGPAPAQWHVGLQGGATAGTFGGGLGEGSDPALGAGITVAVERWLGGGWVIGADGGVVQRGAENLAVGPDAVDVRLRYFDVPITVGRTFTVSNGGWSIGPYAGIGLGWLDSCGVRFQHESRYTECSATTPGGAPEKLDPHVPVGLTLRHRHPGGSRLGLDLRYSPSLSPVLGSGDGDGGARSHALRAMFGYTLPLGESAASAAAPAERGHSTPDRTGFCCDRRRFAPAAGEVALLEVVPWYFNRHYADDSTAVVSVDSWTRNLEQGFEWDADDFRTNMFMHPFHGNAYFNAFRTNGYSFWESVAFPWIGSFFWEFFGENNPPSINDWVATSSGGVVMGEGLYRASRALLDNTATGSERTLRELGAFLLNPVGGVNRLVRGEMTRVGPNPEGRLPSEFAVDSKLGFRVVGEGDLEITDGRANPFVEFAVQYGDPYGPLEAPFEDFLLTVQVNDKDKEVLGRLQIEGPLFRTALVRGENVRHYFGIGLHYDYINNETYELGGQSLSAGLLSEFRLSRSLRVRSRIQLLGSLIAGVDSENAEVTGRSYNLGSGAGLRAYGSLIRNRDRLLEAYYVGHWVHSLSGASGNHAIHFPNITARYPVMRPFGLGVELIFAARNSYYRDFPDVHRENPQFRLFATLMPR